MMLSDEWIDELARQSLAGVDVINYFDKLDAVKQVIRTAVAEATKAERLDRPDRPGHWWYLDHGAKEPVMWIVHPNMEEALHGSSIYLLSMFDGKWVFVPMPEWEGKNDDVER